MNVTCSTFADSNSTDVSGAENEYGSARTDFNSNRFLSDRAKKRRQLLKDKISSVDHGSDQGA